MPQSTKQIIIVGAGIGGLSAAIHLAARGYRVQILERHAQIGGKLNQLKMDGFTFDTGPSLITMPYVLQDLFQAANRRMDDYLELIPLALTCRYFYRDGLILNAWRDHELLAAEFARLNPADGAALYRFIDYTKNIYQAAADPFLYHSLGSPLAVMRTFIRYVLAGHAIEDANTVSNRGPFNSKALAREASIENDQPAAGSLIVKDKDAYNRRSVAPLVLSRLQAVLAALSPKTLDSCVRDFFTDEHLHQLFDRYATYNGSSPYQVASIYSIIPYVELADGGWYPRGGIYALAEALGRLACELGVCIETNCDVKRILVEHEQARGVVLANGCVMRCHAVVANSDVVTTHSELLSPAVVTRHSLHKLTHLEPSCSGFVLLLGVNKQYPQLAHHNIFFSDDYPTEFADLFTRRIPARNPTIYVCATTRSDSSQAPAGYDNLFILVNAPYLTETSNWQRDAPTYHEHILDLLTSYPQIDLHDLREHIVCTTILTPADFKQKYAANAGSIYGLSSNPRMAPFTRPGNRSQNIRHLYFVGGSTHPGGGIPLVTLSGKIVADLVEEDLA